MKELKIRLEKLGIDSSVVVLGRGCGRSKDKRGREDCYVMSSSNISMSVIYVIQYCRDIEQYIAWKNQPDLHRNIFSVICGRVTIVKDGSILSTVKGKEFTWKASEDVYTFNAKGIDRFVEMILKERDKNALI